TGEAFAGVSNSGVLGKGRPRPQGKHRARDLKEDDVATLVAAPPPEAILVEAARPLKIGNAESDDAEALLHADRGSVLGTRLWGRAARVKGTDSAPRAGRHQEPSP